MSATRNADREPALSVVLATDGLATIRETLAHLRGQTAAGRIELVVVAPSGGLIAEGAPAEWAGLHSVRAVECDPRRSLAAARAAGVSEAQAPLVAFAETHCFPEPEWAEALIETHRGPWAAVGPEVGNANPDSGISWAVLLISYGPWVAPAREGSTSHLPGRNSCYKRSVLHDHEEDLPLLLDSESVLHWELGSRGERLYLQPAARVRHRNLADLGPASREALQAGRAFASVRARPWSVRRRLAYAIGSPALPLVRLARILADRIRKRSLPVALTALPALAWLLVVSAAGEAIGYLAGGSESMRRRLASSELSNRR